MATHFSHSQHHSDQNVMMMYTANFDDSSQAASITIDDIDTNFDDNNPHDVNHHSHNQISSTDESCNQCDDCHHDNNNNDDGDSHFSDIAQAAAKAMENIDMDKLCSELFTQEMLEEVTAGMVAPATGVPGVSAAEIAALSTAPGTTGFNGVVSPYPSHLAPTIFAGRNGPNPASHVTVPTTIAVPSKTLYTQPPACPSKAVPRQLLQPIVASTGMPHQPMQPIKPKAPLVAHRPTSAAVHPYVRSSTMPSSLQFSQPRNDVAYRSTASVQQVKKQRSNSGCAVAPRNVNFKRSNSESAVAPRTNATFDVRSNRSAGVQPKTSMAPPKAQLNMAPPKAEPVCVQCQFPGADVRIRCPSGCAYHARCMDLASLCREVNSPPATTSSASRTPKNGNSKTAKLARGPPKPNREVRVRVCPHCALPAAGMEILPLDFCEMDRIQQSARAAFANGCVGPHGGGGSGSKRSREDLMNLPAGLGLPTIVPSHSGAQPRRTVQCYDPSQPRTGRWTDEEILFRDTLISYFLSGSLPLSNGLKLNDFLPIMLKSKQSRLAKKMKNAKLSTKYFYPKTGCVSAPAMAKELSRLEREFVSSIPDPVERSEVKFHMGREWREHFAHRCNSLSLSFDAESWLGSVEDMERRLAFEKERHRLMKRRFMMGKAMEKDCDPFGRALERGVFVSHGKEQGDEFELVVEKSVSNSAGSMGRNRSNSIVNVGVQKEKEASASVWSSNEPNFKHAAPFLAGIASYIERNGVPFEHVDVWVPSFVEDSSVTQGSGSSSSSGAPPTRLCFGGCVTMGVQLVNETSSASGPSSPSMKRTPINPDTKSSLSLFGQYSEKFSFSTGSGLPGRIFQSGIPTWEQFVSEAPANQFERRGGAIQFGVKTAVGLPIDSPNVGRVVLVMYSKYDRPKEERLVGRMMVDLKLLCPCPRWKLVVDVDSPLGGGGEGGGAMSSLKAPPAQPLARKAPSSNAPIGGPVVAVSTETAFSRSTSAGSSISNSSSNTHNAPTNSISPKDQQIKSLLLLLASNIPSDMNSPLGQQLNGIMSLRLILLRGSSRAPEEEALVETVLVLYESYLHAGRSEKDIAVMVARDFTFHLGHLGGLAMRYGGGAASPTHQPTIHTNQICNQGPPPSMYAAAQAVQAQAPAPHPAPPMHISPLMGSIGGYKGQASVPPMGSNPLMGPMGGYSAPQLHQQNHHMRSPPMMGINPMMNPTMNYNHPRMNQSMPFLTRQDSIASFGGSPRSAASR